VALCGLDAVPKKSDYMDNSRVEEVGKVPESKLWKIIRAKRGVLRDLILVGGRF